MIRLLYITVLAIAFMTCVNTRKSQANTSGLLESKRGVLLQIGTDSEFYFLETDSIQPKNLLSLLSDTNKISLEFLNFLTDSKLDEVSATMQPLEDTLYKCGEWAARNQLNYAYVRLDFINEEISLTKWWKDDHNTISRLCIFNPKSMATYHLKFRIPKMTVTRVTMVHAGTG
jgi:hypothetical protein